jgi:hypothetical protein
VTLIVSDGESVGAASFAVEVAPVNDPPSLGPVGPQVSDGGAPVVVPLQVADIDSDVAALVVEAESDNPLLLPAAGIAHGGSGAARTLTLTPTPGESGLARVTVRVSDGDLASAPRGFLLVANSLDPGAVTGITLAGAPLPEHSPPGQVAGVLEATGPAGPVPAAFALLDDADGRFTLAGADVTVFDPARVDFESAASHPLLVSATDAAGGSFSAVVTVELSNVNDPPAVGLPGGFDAVPAVPLALAGMSLADADASPADGYSLRLEVGHGSLEVDEAGLPAGSATGGGTGQVELVAPLGDLQDLLAASDGVRYTGAPGFEGDDVLSVTADDQGHTGPGGPQVVTVETVITVAADAYESWRRENFDEPELADPDVSGAQANLDADVFSTLAEFAVGGDPHRPDAEGEFGTLTETLGGDGLSYPAVRFRRRSAAADPDLAALVYVSAGDGDWATGPGAVTTVAVEPIDDVFEWVTVRSNTPAGAVRQFFQVRFLR